jgi:hypothetical protein
MREVSPLASDGATDRRLTSFVLPALITLTVPVSGQ